MIAKFDKQKIKGKLYKLIRRLVEQKSISAAEYVPPDADQLRRIREQNQAHHEQMLRKAYFYTYK